MATIQQLREQRANAWAQAQEYNQRDGKGDTLTAEDEAAWARALADVDTLGEQIGTREKNETLDKRFAEIDEQTRAAKLDGTLAAPGDSNERDEYRVAFDKYIRGGFDNCTPEQRQLLQANFRAAQSTTTTAGGYTIPQGFWDKVTETLKYYGGIESAGAEVIRTSTGAPLPWPTNDDTGNVGAILDENTQLTTETPLDFGQKQLGAFMYTSKWIKASLQFLQDTSLDAESFIARKAGTRLGRIWNTHFTVGTATTQPQGLITGATVGGTSTAAASVLYDNLIDLEHSVDVAYRAMPTVGWMMNDQILKLVRKLKDTTGLPIWQPSVMAGQPDVLLGRKVTVNNDMAASAASATKTVAFGDFQSAYVIRYSGPGEMVRATERFIDYLQVGFLAYARADGLVQDAAAVKYLLQANS